VHDLSRRSLLLGIGAAGMTGLVGTPALAAARRPFFQRIGLPIGLQIYTLGNVTDLDATFAEVAAIGYREIELPNLLGKQPADIAAAAKRAGLKIGSVHVPLANGSGLAFGAEPAKLAEILGTLGAKWAVAPLLQLPASMRPLPGEDFPKAIARSVAAEGESIWKKSAAALNEAGAKLNPLGIGVAYHNHNVEFAPIAGAPGGSTTGWDILVRETDPRLVSFEVDLGWVTAAGRDPVAFLGRHRGRIKLLHVKDVAAGSPTNFAISMKPTEVGYGTQPGARLLPAAYAAGVRHFYVEQEPPFAIPRIEAARKSYAYLAALKA
jgi:sugar phosphate isomerase/epimerase